jgi:hypothetical protein
LIDCHHRLIARNRHDELIVGDIRRYNTAIHYVRECGTLGPPPWYVTHPLRSPTRCVYHPIPYSSASHLQQQRVTLSYA